MNNFKLRQVKVYNLPAVEPPKINQPSHVIFDFGGEGSIDVGALCFLRRSSIGRRKREEGKLVEADSFCPKREKQVLHLTKLIHNYLDSSGNRVKTIHGKINVFVTNFMEWTDNNGHINVLHTPESAHLALIAYISHLRELVNTNKISINWAARIQVKVIDILNHYFARDDLSHGIHLLARNSNATETTSPPCEIKSSKVLGLSKAIFLGFYDLVVNKQPYPYKFRIPDYLQWKENHLWVFPTSKWCMPPHENTVRNKLKRAFHAYDYQNGRLSHLNEIVDFYPNRYAAENAINAAKVQILSANTNFKHYQRRVAAMLASNAFLIQFFANTGMNKAQVFDLTWDETFKISIEHQGLRVIKWRASGKVCHFEISSGFLPLFKKYLQLRRYLLNLCKKSTDKLFFSLGVSKQPTPRKLKPADIENCFRSFRIIDPDLPKISTREWRAAKSDWAIKNTDPATAALLLQNSQKTILRHYSRGSETKQLEEMGKYFDAVVETIAGKDSDGDNSRDCALGECRPVGPPQPITTKVPIYPNCESPEGCLFCTNYKVHADEKDVRKLISCDHVLSHTARYVTHEKYQENFAPIFLRIKSLLNVIAKRNCSLVSRIRKEVEDKGELSSYWSAKMELLITLGIVPT